MSIASPNIVEDTTQRRKRTWYPWYLAPPQRDGDGKTTHPRDRVAAVASTPSPSLPLVSREVHSDLDASSPKQLPPLHSARAEASLSLFDVSLIAGAQSPRGQRHGAAAQQGKRWLLLPSLGKSRLPTNLSIGHRSNSSRSTHTTHTTTPASPFSSVPAPSAIPTTSSNTAEEEEEEDGPQPLSPDGRSHRRVPPAVAAGLVELRRRLLRNRHCIQRVYDCFVLPESVEKQVSMGPIALPSSHTAVSRLTRSQARSLVHLELLGAPLDEATLQNTQQGTCSWKAFYRGLRVLGISSVSRDLSQAITFASACGVLCSETVQFGKLINMLRPHAVLALPTRITPTGATATQPQRRALRLETGADVLAAYQHTQHAVAIYDSSPFYAKGRGSPRERASGGESFRVPSPGTSRRCGGTTEVDLAVSTGTLCRTTDTDTASPTAPCPTTAAHFPHVLRCDVRDCPASVPSRGGGASASLLLRGNESASCSGIPSMLLCSSPDGDRRGSPRTQPPRRGRHRHRRSVTWREKELRDVLESDGLSAPISEAEVQFVLDRLYDARHALRKCLGAVAQEAATLSDESDERTRTGGGGASLRRHPTARPHGLPNSRVTDACTGCESLSSESRTHGSPFSPPSNAPFCCSPPQPSDKSNSAAVVTTILYAGAPQHTRDLRRQSVCQWPVVESLTLSNNNNGGSSSGEEEQEEDGDDGVRCATAPSPPPPPPPSAQSESGLRGGDGGASETEIVQATTSRSASLVPLAVVYDFCVAIVGAARQGVLQCVLARCGLDGTDGGATVDFERDLLSKLKLRAGEGQTSSSSALPQGLSLPASPPPSSSTMATGGVERRGPVKHGGEGGTWEEAVAQQRERLVWAAATRPLAPEEAVSLWGCLSVGELQRLIAPF